MRMDPVTFISSQQREERKKNKPLNYHLRFPTRSPIEKPPYRQASAYSTPRPFAWEEGAESPTRPTHLPNPNHPNIRIGLQKILSARFVTIRTVPNLQITISTQTSPSLRTNPCSYTTPPLPPPKSSDPQTPTPRVKNSTPL